MKAFDNKVAVITGGNCGIGRATALAFAQKGAKVVIASGRIKHTEEAIQLVKETGSTAIFVKTEMLKAVDMGKLIGQTITTYGHWNYAFHKAGTEEKIALIANLTEEDWDMDALQWMSDL